MASYMTRKTTCAHAPYGLRKHLIDDAAIRRVLLVSPQIYSASDGASEHELYWDNNTQWSLGLQFFVGAARLAVGIQRS